jgi:SAM-dependent methyltransferase
MDAAEAIELIRDAVGGVSGTWADLGAGNGTFTRALVELLGPATRVYSVDRDARAIAEIAKWAKANAPGVVPVVGDITAPLELPGLDGDGLDGLVIANSLHYVPDAGQVLARIAARLRPGARVVFVEYDQRRATPWVPYPVPAERLSELAAIAGLSEPAITATRKSRYGGRLYVAAAERPPLKPRSSAVREPLRG